MAIKKKDVREYSADLALQKASITEEQKNRLTEKQKVTYYIGNKIIDRLQRYVAKKMLDGEGRISMSSIVEAALEEYLKKPEK